jgi:hypothetical protein
VAVIIYGRRSWRRPVGATVGIAAAALVVGLGAPPASASVSATRGGFLVRPDHFRSATVQFRVPRLACTSAATTHVQVGLFGHTADGHQTTPWFAAITSLCRRGTQHSYEVFGDFTPVQKKTVHPGDLVRITTRGNAPMSTITDTTTGTRLTGGPFPPPGQVTVPRVTIGARRIGSAAGHINILMNNVAVNGKPISSSSRQQQVQMASGRRIVWPGALNSAGTGFSLYVV